MTHAESEAVPKGVLAMIGALLAVAIALSAAASFGIVDKAAVPSEARAAAGTVAVSERYLYFHDGPDGAVLIEDAADGQAIARVDPGTGGFVRSTLRSLVHVRRSKGIDAETPFRLTLWDDGALSLSDSETGKSVELGSFGPDNRAAFSVLLPEGTA